MSEFLQSSRPVLFESNSGEDLSDKYYWGRGSSFLASYNNQFYFITARHVIDNQNANPDLLRIFPTDESSVTIPFNQLYLLNPEGGKSAEEYHDIYLLRIDIPLQAKESDTSLFSVNLNNSLLSPGLVPLDKKLAIIGFPSDTREVNYENLKIKYKRSAMSAKFKGRSNYDHCYSIEFTDTLGHECIDGMSGAPIFSFDNNNEGTMPRFIGIMLRGSGASRIGHFVSSLVIKKALDDINQQKPNK